MIGKIEVDETADITNSAIRGPAIIGEGAHIVSFHSGLFTSIYPHCKIRGSEVEHTIIMERSCIIDVDQHIEDSATERNAQLICFPLEPKACKVHLGDNSHVGRSDQ